MNIKEPEGLNISLNFAITEAQRDKLTVLAKATRIPKSTLMREALEDLLKKYAHHFVDSSNNGTGS
jgi:predicted transcriptional regulator